MKQFFKSLSYAIKGLDVFWREKHIKIHVVAMLLVIAAGLYFHITQTEWLICLILFALVISIEIINTAIEHLVNLVSPEFNPLAGKIKDLAAGAVLFSAIIAFIAGCLIFTKYILALF